MLTWLDFIQEIAVYLYFHYISKLKCCKYLLCDTLTLPSSGGVIHWAAQKEKKSSDLPGYMIHSLTYEPVQVFTLIWLPQDCKNYSPIIWMQWYPKPRLKSLFWSKLSDGVSCLSWWFIIFMAKNVFVSRNGKKRLFLENKSLHLVFGSFDYFVQNKLFSGIFMKQLFIGFMAI